MKILITGINGAHARMVALRLLAQGHEILGIDRRTIQRWLGEKDDSAG